MRKNAKKRPKNQPKWPKNCLLLLFSRNLKKLSHKTAIKIKGTPPDFGQNARTPT
jgi:hypothetical protein